MGLEPSIELDARDVSEIFLDFLGLWDGMDSGIGAICTQDVSGMSLGFPELWDGMDSWIAVEHLGRVPGLPGTQGWDGQWDWSPLQWDTRDMSRMSLGWDGHWDWSRSV